MNAKAGHGYGLSVPVHAVMLRIGISRITGIVSSKPSKAKPSQLLPTTRRPTFPRAMASDSSSKVCKRKHV